MKWHLVVLCRIGVLLFSLVCGCQSPKETERVQEFTGIAMTIPYKILVGASIRPDEEEKIRTIIKHTFAEVDSVYNKWNPQSELSKLNELKSGQKVALSPQLLLFFELADNLIQLSQGLLDPTIEPLQELWKKHLEQGDIPSEEEIRLIAPCLGWDKIILSNGYFSKLDSRTKLDLGGIAKGYAVDLLTNRLEEVGYPNLYVEWGGEIRAIGKHPSQRPWSIYISRLGDPDPSKALTIIQLKNQAIATSGDYFQNWTVIDLNGQQTTYSHIFNPKTLAPLQVRPGSVASASLIAHDCLTADAFAKILMLFDTPEEAADWVKKMQSFDPQMACWIVTH